MKNHPTARPERGAAYVELAIVLPLLIIFLTGLIQLGHYLAQVDWVAQTAYLSAIEGAQSESSERVERMMNRATELNNVLHDVSHLATVINSASTSTENETVRMTFGGSLTKLMGASPDLQFSLSAPVLINANAGLSTGNLNTFQNYTVATGDGESKVELCNCSFECYDGAFSGPCNTPPDAK